MTELASEFNVSATTAGTLITPEMLASSSSSSSSSDPSVKQLPTELATQVETKNIQQSLVSTNSLTNSHLELPLQQHQQAEQSNPSSHRSLLVRPTPLLPSIGPGLSLSSINQSTNSTPTPIPSSGGGDNTAESDGGTLAVPSVIRSSSASNSLVHPSNAGQNHTATNGILNHFNASTTETLIQSKIQPIIDANSSSKDLTTYASGLVGLGNLGNTCFLNSAVQSLSFTRPLTIYFQKGFFVREINHDNPLGYGGKLAMAYAKLLRQIWNGKPFDSLKPQEFKLIIGKLRPQFVGHSQHDAQEFITFLLDGLHEDLNRVKQKPSLMNKDSDGREDGVVAYEYWTNYLLRNQSVITDLFTGLMKSTLTFACQRTSVTFDPYTSLSLPLPKPKPRFIELTIFFAHASKVPIVYSIELVPTHTIAHVKHRLSQLSGIPPSNLQLGVVFRHVVLCFLLAWQSVDEIKSKDSVIAWEVDGLKKANESGSATENAGGGEEHQEEKVRDNEEFVTVGDRFDVRDSVKKWLTAKIMDIRASGLSLHPTIHVANETAKHPEESEFHRVLGDSPHSSMSMGGLHPPYFNLIEDRKSREEELISGEIDERNLTMSRKRYSLTSRTDSRARRASDVDSRVNNEDDDLTAYDVHHNNNDSRVSTDDGYTTIRVHPEPTSIRRYEPSTQPSTRASTPYNGIDNLQAIEADDDMLSHSTLAPPVVDSHRPPSRPPSPAPEVSFVHVRRVPTILPTGAVVEVLIHYDGWSNKWDEWLNLTSERIAAFQSQSLQQTALQKKQTRQEELNLAADVVCLHFLHRKIAATQHQPNSSSRPPTPTPPPQPNQQQQQGPPSRPPTPNPMPAPTTNGPSPAISRSPSPSPNPSAPSSPPLTAVAGAAPPSPAVPSPPTELFGLPLLLYVQNSVVTAADLYARVWERMRRYAKAPPMNEREANIFHSLIKHQIMGPEQTTNNQEDTQKDEQSQNAPKAAAEEQGAVSVGSLPEQTTQTDGNAALTETVHHSTNNGKSGGAGEAIVMEHLMPPTANGVTNHVSGLSVDGTAVRSNSPLPSPNDPNGEVPLSNGVEFSSSFLTSALFPPFVLKTVNRSGTMCSSCPQTAQCSGCTLDLSTNPLTLAPDAHFAIEWNSQYLCSPYFSSEEYCELILDPAVEYLRRYPEPPLSIDDCFHLFTREETLPPDAMVYCSSCKKHEQVKKRIDLWTTPTILVLHLKRLLVDGKVYTYLKCPMKGLDLSGFLPGANASKGNGAGVGNGGMEIVIEGEVSGAADVPSSVTFATSDSLSHSATTQNGSNVSSSASQTSVTNQSNDGLNINGHSTNNHTQTNNILKNHSNHVLLPAPSDVNRQTIPKSTTVVSPPGTRPPSPSHSISSALPSSSQPSPPTLPPSTSLYDLFAVIHHHGTSQSGHYTCAVLHHLLNRWYLIDDNKIRPCEEEEVMNQSVYLLLYQKRAGKEGTEKDKEREKEQGGSTGSANDSEILTSEDIALKRMDSSNIIIQHLPPDIQAKMKIKLEPKQVELLKQTEDKTHSVNVCMPACSNCIIL